MRRESGPRKFGRFPSGIERGETNPDSSVIHPTWIRTPLIDELLRKPGFNDIVLEPETVAETVVKQVLRGESAQIVLPGRLSWFVTSLRGFPSWLQEGLRNGKGQTLSRLVY